MKQKIVFCLIVLSLLSRKANGKSQETNPVYIQAPESPQRGENPCILLAGGCCVPWRKGFAKLLKGHPVVLLDPIGDEKERPLWEHQYIERADILLLWFPAQGECRGSLVELGRFLETKNKPLFVGVDPQSPLFHEIALQIKLRPEVSIATSIEALAHELCAFIDPHKKQ